jgi:hypothetical protein
MADLQPDLEQFARRIMEDWPENGDIDGWQLQDIAVECGLLIPTTVTEPCCDDCQCSDTGFPTTCYRRCDLLRAQAVEKGLSR